MSLARAARRGRRSRLCRRLVRRRRQLRRGRRVDPRQRRVRRDGPHAGALQLGLGAAVHDGRVDTAAARGGRRVARAAAARAPGAGLRQRRRGLRGGACHRGGVSGAVGPADDLVARTAAPPAAAAAATAAAAPLGRRPGSPGGCALPGAAPTPSATRAGCVGALRCGVLHDPAMRPEPQRPMGAPPHRRTCGAPGQRCGALRRACCHAARRGTPRCGCSPCGGRHCRHGGAAAGGRGPWRGSRKQQLVWPPLHIGSAPCHCCLARALHRFFCCLLLRWGRASAAGLPVCACRPASTHERERVALLVRRPASSRDSRRATANTIASASSSGVRSARARGRGFAASRAGSRWRHSHQRPAHAAIIAHVKIKLIRLPVCVPGCCDLISAPYVCI